MSSLQSRLLEVRSRIRKASDSAGLCGDTVHLIAVSKTYGAASVREAVAAGQRDFGENYLDEALSKIEALAGQGLCWHFIGPLQSNKTRQIAEAFDWVHSLDREKLALRLSAQRPAELAPLQVCVQVNISGEASKSGVAPEQAEALCACVAALPGLKLRGLMAIPDPAQPPDPQYLALQQLQQRLVDRGHALDTLSAGMSGDLESAIAHGATHVRVGTAIFGARLQPHTR